MPYQKVLPFVPDPSLAEARAQVMEDRWNDGTTCPCCDQFARVYRRLLHGSQVRWLMYLAEASLRLRRQFYDRSDLAVGNGWVSKDHWTIRPEGGDYGKLVLWGLTEALSEPEAERYSTGGRSGIWRPTLLGIEFVYGVTPVPAWVLVYNGELVSLDPDAPLVYARNVAGTVFNYDELLATMPRDAEGRQ